MRHSIATRIEPRTLRKNRPMHHLPDYNRESPLPSPSIPVMFTIADFGINLPFVERWNRRQAATLSNELPPEVYCNGLENIVNGSNKKESQTLVKRASDIRLVVLPSGFSDQLSKWLESWLCLRVVGAKAITVIVPLPKHEKLPENLVGYKRLQYLASLSNHSLNIDRIARTVTKQRRRRIRSAIRRKRSSSVRVAPLDSSGHQQERLFRQ